MRIDTRTVSNITILDISGRITIGEGSTEIRKRIQELLSTQQTKILLNLGEVSDIDSAGLGVLVSSYASVTNQGGALKLLNLTKRLTQLLVLTKLVTVFDTYGDEQDAIASFS